MVLFVYNHVAIILATESSNALPHERPCVNAQPMVSCRVLHSCVLFLGQPALVDLLYVLLLLLLFCRRGVSSAGQLGVAM
jgi:hypothetical protein